MKICTATIILYLRVSRILAGILYNLDAFRKIAKGDYYFRHTYPSVCPNGTTRLPPKWCSWNLVLEDFSKICRENSSFI